MTVEEQRADGDEFAHRPVDGVVVEHCRAPLQLRHQAWVRCEARRQIYLRVSDLLEDVEADSRLHVSRRDRLNVSDLRLMRNVTGIASLGEGLLEVAAVVAQRGL